MTATRVRLMLADVDGTLVTSEKVLTDRAIEAVHRLHDAGIHFSITSGRPPRGMAMLVKPLALQGPLAGFNGGVIVDPGMTVLEQRLIPEGLVLPIDGLMRSFGLDVWVYRGADWYVPDPDGPHVAREARTVQFQPKVMTRIEDLTDNLAKIVGVSDDHDAVTRAADRGPRPVRGSRDRGRVRSPTTSTSPTPKRTRAPWPGTWPRGTGCSRPRSPPLATCRTMS